MGSYLTSFPALIHAAELAEILTVHLHDQSEVLDLKYPFIREGYN